MNNNERRIKCDEETLANCDQYNDDCDGCPWQHDYSEDFGDYCEGLYKSYLYLEDL